MLFSIFKGEDLTQGPQVKRAKNDDAICASEAHVESNKNMNTEDRDKNHNQSLPVQS